MRVANWVHTSSVFAIYAAFFFDPGGRPGPRRRLRRRRPFLAFGTTDVTIFLVLPASVWVEVELPAVEVDRGLEVLAVAEAAGGVADPLDRRVEPLGGGVGDAVAQVRE